MWIIHDFSVARNTFSFGGKDVDTWCALLFMYLTLKSVTSRTKKESP